MFHVKVFIFLRLSECHNAHTSMSLVLLPEYFAGHRNSINKCRSEVD